MSIGKKILDMIAPEEEETLFEVSKEDAKRMGYEKAKGTNPSFANAKLVMFEPRSYDDAQEIAKHLVEGRACIVNFHRIKKEFAQRIIDFLSGVIYAINGSINKSDVNSYLCSPHSLGVVGEIDLDSSDI